MERRRRIAVVTVVVEAVLALVVNQASEQLGWLQPWWIPWLLLAALVGLAAVLADRADRRNGTPADDAGRRAAVADLLADGIGHQWEREMRVRLLADPAPMPVFWRPTARPVADRHTGLPPVTRSDHADALARAFDDGRWRRLVLLGGPGSGKTTLAVLLVLGLLRSRAPGGPVPVLVTLTGWDTGTHPELWDWLAERVDKEYPALRCHGDDAARLLVRRRGVLPVLDGLDELPAPYRTTVLTALNRSLNPGDAVVLSCRTTAFEDTVADGDVLTGAAVLEAEPLGRGDAAAYLDACIPPGRVTAWAPVLRALRDGDAPALAGVCSTPLGSWLVRTVYVEGRRDPAPLADPAVAPDPRTLHAHLFDRLIPAVVDQDHHRRAAARTASSLWGPDHIRHWLATLAAAMNAEGTRDLRWWRLRRYPVVARTRWRRLRPVAGALAGLTSGAVVGLRNATLFADVPAKSFDQVFDSSTPSGAAPMVMTLAPAAALMTVGAVQGILAARHPEPRVAGLRWTLAVAGGLFGQFLIAPVFFMFFAFLALNSQLITWSSGAAGVIAGAAVGVWAAELGWRAVPVRADLRLRGRLTALGRALAPGLGIGAAIAAAFSVVIVIGIRSDSGTALPGEIVVLVFYFLLFTFLIAVVYALVRGFGVWATRVSPLDGAGTPRHTLRQDRAFALLRAGIWVTPLAIVAIALVEQTDSVVDLAVYALSLVCVLGGGLCVLGRSAWFGYAAVVIRGVVDRRLPRRLMPFLDEMHRLGLLRTVGAVYQFRHAAFQDHLAATPPPDRLRPPGSPDTTTPGAPMSPRPWPRDRRFNTAHSG